MGQQRHAHDAQAQEPVACCLLQVAADVALRVASRLQRTNFGFICNFTLAEEFEEDREKEGGRGVCDLAVSLAINH